VAYGSRVVSDRAGFRRRRARIQIAAATLSGNSLRQTVHTRRASVHQAAKLVAALLRVAGVTAGLGGKYNTIQYNTKFVKRHVAVASEALANRTVKKHRRRRSNGSLPPCLRFTSTAG